jgi:hypothetical protein
MQSLYSLCAVLAVCGFLSVAAYGAQKCPENGLSQRMLLDVVKAQIKERGGDTKIVDDRSRTRVEIATIDCDYLVRLTSIPEKPGGFTIYRVSRTKKIVDVLPGAK